jgi:tetratricopeptide (TPR) repeat protein
MYMQGDIEAAFAEIEQEPLGWMKQSGSAILLHKMGRTEEAERFLAMLIREDDEEYALYQQGQVNAQWGNAEQAMKCLNRALHFGDPGLSQLLVDPLLDPVRDDPRFIELLAKIGFESA